MCMSREHVQIQLVFKSGSFLGEKTFPNTQKEIFFCLCVLSYDFQFKFRVRACLQNFLFFAL